jgi:hypothetical protein
MLSDKDSVWQFVEMRGDSALVPLLQPRIIIARPLFISSSSLPLLLLISPPYPLAYSFLLLGRYL